MHIFNFRSCILFYFVFTAGQRIKFSLECKPHCFKSMTQCIRLSAVSTSISQIDASCSACFEFYQKRQQQTLCLRQRRIQDYAFILRTHGPADHCSLKFCAISFITSSSPIFFANGFGPLNRIFWIFLKKIHSSGEF